MSSDSPCNRLRTALLDAGAILNFEGPAASAAPQLNEPDAQVQVEREALGGSNARRGLPTNSGLDTVP
jgi:hypothetical protein